MSAGKFSRSKYQASYNTSAIHPIRIQPETALMSKVGSPGTTNAAPTGSITNEISAQVSAGKRQLGLKPRKFVLELVGDPPDNYEEGSRVTLPILTESFFTGVAKGDTVSYLGTTWQVVSKNVEDIS
jgi:hypothetical protein